VVEEIEGSNLSLDVNWFLIHGNSIVDTPGLEAGEETMAPAGARFATIATPLTGECQKCGLTFR